MKTTYKAYMAAAVAALSLGTTSCIEEIDPQTSTVTAEQAANAPGAYDKFAGALTSSLVGEFTYNGSGNTSPYDFGFPSFYLQRDCMGQDIVPTGSNNWFSVYYDQFQNISPSSARAQVPWTYFYKWIKNCNTVIQMAGDNPADNQLVGLGTAHAMRALFYMDLARMFASKAYSQDKTAPTVPIITESTTAADAQNNPRATNEEMFAFIISDLDKAEQELAGYKRTDVYSVDLSVVYGLKARAYLEMQDWANAENYAKKAQEGYTVMDEATYLSRETGFNSPNSSWIFGTTFKSDDPNILLNDADSSWGSMMVIEINPKTSGCGYAANYGDPFVIDYHLYQTIPATDFRKKCFVDFAIDELGTQGEIYQALEAYSDHPEAVYNAGHAGDYGRVGGLELKFRGAGGEEGYNNQYIAFTIAVPMMRVEEMKLIEAEAAGMQSEARGIELLTAFAKTRDAEYQYGTHQDLYGNNTASTFQNEVWWQRRVELWGEGFTLFDIKRFNKGIVRSYAGTNHIEGSRFNTTSAPEWMNWCIVQTETNYNKACTNNPTATRPSGDSPEASF